MFDRVQNRLVGFVMFALAGVAAAQPVYIFHGPANQVFGEASGVTMREPEVPREAEVSDLWSLGDNTR